MDRIDALRLFTRLVERGSFSSAARDLKIKQSTASKWIAQLEAELGSTLVQRTTRSVRVTDEGQRLLLRAREILAAFDDMRTELQARSPEPSGLIRVSVPVVFGRRFVVPAIADFLKRHPLVHLELILNDRYVNLVEEGFDLAVRVGVPVDTTARGRKLADGRRVLVAAPAYLKARGRPARPRDLRRHECLVHGEVSAATVWRFGRTSGAEVPVQVSGRLVANNSEAVLAMVRGGLGIGLVADWLVEEELRRGHLEPLLEGFSAPPAPVYVLSPQGRFPTTTARLLTEHLAATLQSRLAPTGSRSARGPAPAR